MSDVLNFIQTEWGELLAGAAVLRRPRGPAAAAALVPCQRRPVPGVGWFAGARPSSLLWPPSRGRRSWLGLLRPGGDAGSASSWSEVLVFGVGSNYRVNLGHAHTQAETP